MKRMLLLPLLAAAFVPLRADDDLLQNGDFSDGVAHWYGDIQAANDVPETPTPGKGAVVKLRPRDWTRVTHDLELRAGSYLLHVSLVFSSDLHFSTDYSDYINLRAKVDFPDVMYRPDGEPGQGIVVMADTTAGTSRFWRIRPQVAAGAVQSYTLPITGIDFNNRQTLILAFPPGTGLVALQKVWLEKK